MIRIFSVQCICKQGWNGSNCEIPVKQCSFCLNGGECIPRVPTRCECPDDFYGNFSIFSLFSSGIEICNIFLLRRTYLQAPDAITASIYVATTEELVSKRQMAPKSAYVLSATSAKFVTYPNVTIIAKWCDF